MNFRQDIRVGGLLDDKYLFVPIRQNYKIEYLD